MKDVSRKKRKRNPNWDDAEKTLLMNCLKDKLDIIENKNTDTDTNNSKKIAWQRVFESFIELNTKQRTLTEIKQQWRTLKINAKNGYSTFIKTHMQTGEETLGYEEGVNGFECVNITHNVSVTRLDDTDDNINNLEELQDEDFIKDQTPQQITPANISARRDLIESSLTTSGRKRQKINEEQKVSSNNKKERDAALINFLREEHELKMEHMVNNDTRAQEEHVLRIKNLILQNKLLEKQLSKFNE